jgi:phosphoribosylformylglycinamidine (FGAM) synthase-like enzyme
MVLKKDEYAKICELLDRTPNITELGNLSQQCGMNTVHINHQDFT